jgi:hypothetical protein
LESSYVPVEHYKALVDEYQKQQNQFAYFVANPHLIAMHKGDLYLRKQDIDLFREPLAEFFFHVIPRWATGVTEDAEPRPGASAPDAAAVAVPPAVPGLREIVAPVVASVLALLHEAGMLGAVPSPPLGAAARPGLPQELHPAAAPTAVTGEVAGAWAPPPRPPIQGPRSAVRRAFYDMLTNS